VEIGVGDNNEWDANVGAHNFMEISQYAGGQ
jgi:hypothetical protein